MSTGHTGTGPDDSGAGVSGSDLYKQVGSLSTAQSSLSNDLGPLSGDIISSDLDIEKVLHSSQAAADPNIVNWDGPDDPTNPLNWAKPTRLGQVGLISVITLVAYVFYLLNLG